MATPEVLIKIRNLEDENFRLQDEVRDLENEISELEDAIDEQQNEQTLIPKPETVLDQIKLELLAEAFNKFSLEQLQQLLK